jgi:hypothetical protein
VLTAVRAQAPPVIDGVLDDAVWAAAAPDEGFVQQYPAEGAPAGRKTELRIAYDDQAVYVAFRCHDDPARVVARLTRRDRDVEADAVEITLDTHGDGTDAYGFRVNAAGVQLDTLYYNDSSATTDWDAVWTAAARVDEGGWSAELAIPLSALRFPARDVQRWGLEAQRYISADKEVDQWALVPRSAPGFVGFFGKLEGLRGLSPRRTFELRPYLATGVVVDTPEGGSFLALGGGPNHTDSTTEAGLDLKLGLTSALTFDATLNPDFAQVEADQVVLNLSRFETFFPEKRPFFLESLDLFTTGLVQTFYTRRIGKPTSGLADGDSFVTPSGESVTLSEAARALRILGAGKVTGKVTDGLQLGLLAAVTDREEVSAQTLASGDESFELAPRRLFSVARALYSFGTSSTVGLEATGLTRLGGSLWRAAADHDAYTQDVDAQWVIDPARWRLLIQGVLSERVGGPRFAHADGTACAAEGVDCMPLARNDGTLLEPGAVGAGVNALLVNTGEHHIARLAMHSYSSKLELNDLGYLPQVDEHSLRAVGGYAQRRPSGPLNYLNLQIGGQIDWTTSGVLKQAFLFIYADLQSTSFFNLQAELDLVPPSWDVYETYDGSRFEQPGRTIVDLTFASDSRRAVVLSGEQRAAFDGAGGYDIYARLGGALQVLSQLELSLTPEGGTTNAVRFDGCTTAAGAACSADSGARSYRFARLDSSFFSLTLRGSWTFSPRLTLQAYGQLFLATGAYSNYRGLDVTAPHATLRRADLAPIAFNGDTNGDGIKDDDFQRIDLNINLVLRWEFYPGSTLIGVYTRSESALPPLAGAAPRLGVSGITRGPTEDVFLLKLVYFIS